MVRMIITCNIYSYHIGTPWFVAATVAAITHVQTLRRVSEITAPGEKPVFIGAR